jgi:hypothetical protein
VLDTPTNAVNDQTTKFSGTVGLRESDTFAAWWMIVLDEPAKRQLLIGALIGRSPIVLTKTAKSTLQKPCLAELSESAFFGAKRDGNGRLGDEQQFSHPQCALKQRQTNQDQQHTDQIKASDNLRF